MEEHIEFNFIYSDDALRVKTFLGNVPRSIECINYIDILRVVRKKHRDIYSIHNLYKVWKVWKDMPKPFPLIFYILMYLATEYLPGNIYNYIYKKIRFLKQSERISD